jgi:endonuclease/exonuclease/phosphatase (EEP) superfamily protein YafD
VIKVVSWNLYYRSGASLDDVLEVIERENPDLLLMQEATPAIDEVVSIAGGSYHRQPWHDKKYGLAAWSASSQLETRLIELPISVIPGIFPRRASQVVNLGSMNIANVHLSHGQVLNRRQLRAIARNIGGPLAVIGDFNALGPIALTGFSDVGPAFPTHMMNNIMPLRLDRCLARDLVCVRSRVLEKGRSDHRPIVLEFAGRVS